MVCTTLVLKKCDQFSCTHESAPSLCVTESIASSVSLTKTTIDISYGVPVDISSMNEFLRILKVTKCNYKK